jgi:hypothetical protein
MKMDGTKVKMLTKITILVTDKREIKWRKPKILAWFVVSLMFTKATRARNRVIKTLITHLSNYIFQFAQFWIALTLSQSASRKLTAIFSLLIKLSRIKLSIFDFNHISIMPNLDEQAKTYIILLWYYYYILHNNNVWVQILRVQIHALLHHWG